MPHVLQTKNGKLIVPFKLEDVFDEIEEQMGDEIRTYLENWILEADAEREDAVSEYDSIEKEMEQLREHQSEVLYNISQEVDALDTLLSDERLNRKRMQGAVRILQQMIYRET